MVNKLAIVQGRLSSLVADNYQYFPIHGWREEFDTAKLIGFNGIEWVLSDLSNPLFDPHSREEIVDIVNQTGVAVSSVSLDLFKEKTLNLFSFKQIEWVLKGISALSKKIKIGRVSFPIEENSTIFDPFTKKEVVQVLQKVMELAEDLNFKICIETDLSPKTINFLLAQKEINNLGLVVDIGNTAANGYDLSEYFDLFGNKIFGIHVKDRILACGPSVKFGEGSAEFDVLKSCIKEAQNLNDITLQSFRTEVNYIEDAKESRNHLLKFLDF